LALVQNFRLITFSRARAQVAAAPSADIFSALRRHAAEAARERPQSAVWHQRGV